MDIGTGMGLAHRIGAQGSSTAIAGVHFLQASIAVALVGAIIDIRSSRLPNVLTLSTFVAAIALHFSVAGFSGLCYSAAAGLLAGALFLLPYLMGGMGAGDVKMAGALGALVSFGALGTFLVATAIAGGICALLYAILKGRLIFVLRNVQRIVMHLRYGFTAHKDINLANASLLRFPYGIAFFLGALSTYVSAR